jgi:hypothetical protein
MIEGLFHEKIKGQRALVADPVGQEINQGGIQSGYLIGNA